MTTENKKETVEFAGSEKKKGNESGGVEEITTADLKLTHHSKDSSLKETNVAKMDSLRPRSNSQDSGTTDTSAPHSTIALNLLDFIRFVFFLDCIPSFFIFCFFHTKHNTNIQPLKLTITKIRHIQPLK